MQTQFKTVHNDVYDGLTIKSNENKYSSDQLELILPESLIQWKNEGKRGIWIRVSIEDSEWIPVCIKNGFDFHHSNPGYCTLTKWLDDTVQSRLPKYPFTSVGCGGLVANTAGDILLIKERQGSYKGWKFPGGLADPGEGILDAVKREVIEETGVEVVAQTILCFRHVHTTQFEHCSDLFFLCKLAPIAEGRVIPKKCEFEIAECRWFSQDEIMRLPDSEFSPLSRYAVEQYKNIENSTTINSIEMIRTINRNNSSWTIYAPSSSCK